MSDLSAEARKSEGGSDIREPQRQIPDIAALIQAALASEIREITGNPR